MPRNRMNRDEFHAKISGYDADQSGKILWTLYRRGFAPMRERIEAQLDPDGNARQQGQKAAPPSSTAVGEDVREFIALARSGACLAGDRPVSPEERTFLQAQSSHTDAVTTRPQASSCTTASKGCPATRTSTISPDGSVRPYLHEPSRIVGHATDDG